MAVSASEGGFTAGCLALSCLAWLAQLPISTCRDRDGPLLAPHCTSNWPDRLRIGYWELGLELETGIWELGAFGRSDRGQN